MKKGMKGLVFAALLLAVSFSAKTQSEAAVNNLKQTEASETSVKVAWDSVLGKDRYDFVVTDGVNSVSDYAYSNSAYISGLTAGRDYTVIVDGTSVSVSTVPSDDNIKAYQVGATTTSITERVTASSGANYYVLKINDLVYGVSSTNTVKTSKALTPGTNYTVKMYPCRRNPQTGYIAMHQYNYSSDYYAKTLVGKLPTSTFGVLDSWININSYNVGLKHGGVSFDKLQVQYLNAKGKVKRTVTVNSGYSSTYDGSSRLNGTFYQYRMRTGVTCGTKVVYSPWSACKTIGIPKDCSYKSSKSKITVSFKPVSGASKYYVYASKNENSGYKLIKTCKANKRTVTFSKIGKKKLKKGTKYYVRIVPAAKIKKKTVKAQTYAYYSVYTRSY